MATFCSLFSQILKIIPHGLFVELMAKHDSERHARGFTSWQQLVSMMFCHLAKAQSLREIENGLRSAEGKLNHLAIKPPPRSTLSYANAHRPWELYRSVFYAVLEQCHAVQRGHHRFKFKNPLLSIDSTTIQLVAEMFSWAQYCKSKGAVKLHLMLDHDGLLPVYGVITDRFSSDITVARSMSFQRGSILVFDRGYIDYAWFSRLTAEGVYFVTRLKKNCHYHTIETRPAPRGIVSDQVVEVYDVRSARRPDYSPLRLRRVELIAEDGSHLVFFSNHFKLGATTIAAIYKDRWQIELFFKALKQNLKVKTFIGTSSNALHIQLWTALTAILMIRYLQLKSMTGLSLSNLFAMLRIHLFAHHELWTWLREPFASAEPPPLQLQLV